MHKAGLKVKSRLFFNRGQKIRLIHDRYWHKVTADIKSQQTYSWTSPAQSKLREPFGVARAACFEQLAGVLCQLRCWFHADMKFQYSIPSI